MCLHNNGVGSDRVSSDNAVVLSCNHFGIGVSAAASLYRVSTKKFHLTGPFIGWDIPLIAVIPGIAIQGTLLALLLDPSAGSGNIGNAVAANFMLISWILP